MRMSFQILLRALVDAPLNKERLRHYAAASLYLSFRKQMKALDFKHDFFFIKRDSLLFFYFFLDLFLQVLHNRQGIQVI